MADPMLGRRALSRATLARQLLLERAPLTASAAITRLAGLQAQLASAPFVGLWTRLHGFSRAALAEPIASHAVVKATWLRATLHLVTADDYVRFRATLAPVLAGAASAIATQRGAGFDRDNLLTVARDYIAAQPRTFAQISAMLAALYPDEDVGAMRYTVRTQLPLVQVPTDNPWSFPGQPAFTLAEPWIGQRVAPAAPLRELVLRYLAAFGPASVADMQAWSGLAKLQEVVELLRPELQMYRGEGRRELFDLPDLPLPDPDQPAPVRFLPEYDNLLLSHRDRRRIVADEHRKQVYLPGLRVRATILVDGFVAGAWSIERVRKAATLVIEPFGTLAAPDRDALVAEGEALLRFVEPEATTVGVRFNP